MMITVTPCGPNEAGYSITFVVRTPCGQASLGMRHTDDVRQLVDRALDHIDECANCKSS